MAHSHISGKNIHIFLDGVMITVDKFTLKITDNMEVQKTNGIPDGYTEGDVAAGGEITMSYKYFKAMGVVAASHGGWRSMPTFDIDAIGATSDDVFPVNAYDCKLRLDSLVDADKNGKEKGMVTIPYDVTGSDFVKIYGVPYLDHLESVGVF